jgi:DNA-binding winged helix-turn-helix (wHTH) protein
MTGLLAPSMRARTDASLGTFGGCSWDATDRPNIPDIIRAVGSPAVLRFHGFELDAGSRLLRRGGERIHLTRKAFDFLVLLVEQAPRVVTKEELHQQLWPGTFVSDVTVAGVVKELRHAFRDHGCDESIVRTAHGVGYAFAGTIEAPAVNDNRNARFCLVAGSRRVVLVPGENGIGRDPGAAVWLDSPQASRHHARITVAGDAAVLEDLGSKNCTLVNELRVSGPTRLSDGDSIQIGSMIFVFRVMDTTASTETATSRPPL